MRVTLTEELAAATLSLSLLEGARRLSLAGWRAYRVRHPIRLWRQREGRHFTGRPTLEKFVRLETGTRDLFFVARTVTPYILRSIDVRCNTQIWGEDQRRPTILEIEDIDLGDTGANAASQLRATPNRHLGLDAQYVPPLPVPAKEERVYRLKLEALRSWAGDISFRFSSDQRQILRVGVSISGPRREQPRR